MPKTHSTHDNNRSKGRTPADNKFPTGQEKPKKTGMPKRSASKERSQAVAEMVSDAIPDSKPPEEPDEKLPLAEPELRKGRRRHSQMAFDSQQEEYPIDYFDESLDSGLPILRHPYYNELTEDLGQAAETLLEERSNLDSSTPSTSSTATVEDISTLSSVTDTVKDSSSNSIPVVNVDLQESVTAKLEDIPARKESVSKEHHHHHHHHYHEAAIDEAMDPDDTCNVNYGLLNRYLDTLIQQPLNAADLDRFAFYSAKTGFVRAPSLLTLSPFLSQVMQSGTFWLDVCMPSPLELKVFGDVFKMHPLTLEDIQLDDVREKCDVFENYFVVCLKAFEANNAQGTVDYSQPINLYILAAGKSCVVSFHHQPLRFSQTIAKRIRLLSARTGLSTDWIMYGILDDVIDSFSPTIYECDEQVELIDDQCMQPGVGKLAHESIDENVTVTIDDTLAVTKSDSPTMFQRITALRKRLTLLQRLISSKNEVLRNVVKRCGSRLSEDALVYLRDLQDHVHMIEQTLGHQDDALNRAYSNYLAHISIETSHISNRMSKVMKTLSAFAAVTTPCTVVSCLLGMNLRGPFWPYGEDRNGPGSGSGGPFDFIFVFSFILTATFMLVYVGKRNDWF